MGFFKYCRMLLHDTFCHGLCERCVLCDSEPCITVIENAQRTIYCAKNQQWTNEAIKELREKYSVIYLKNGCIALRREGDLVQLSIEDDGCISFEKNGGFTFNRVWLNDAIRVLEEAKNPSF